MTHSYGILIIFPTTMMFGWFSEELELKFEGLRSMCHLQIIALLVKSNDALKLRTTNYSSNIIVMSNDTRKQIT